MRAPSSSPVDGVTVDELRTASAIHGRPPSRGTGHRGAARRASRGGGRRRRSQKLHSSARGGFETVYQFDRSESYCFLYAHLNRYASGLREGNGDLRKGHSLVGYVGTMGNAPRDVPHLHFILLAHARTSRWQGEPVIFSWFGGLFQSDIGLATRVVAARGPL